MGPESAKEPQRPSVSAGNPCPFLRALVAEGHLADDVEPLDSLTRTVVRVAAAGDGTPSLPGPAVRLIAMIAGGVSPLQQLSAVRHGVRLDRLRGGPLDKKGAGSGILDQQAHVVESELERLAGFGSEKSRPDGTIEPGLDQAEITRYMDANFERTRGHRRRIDRRLMNGEWPVLLRVMGRDGATGRYLAVDDVRRLIVDRRLPQRMMDRLSGNDSGSA